MNATCDMSNTTTPETKLPFLSDEKIAQLQTTASAVRDVAAVIGSPNKETALALGKQALTSVGTALVSFGVITPGVWSLVSVAIGALLTGAGIYWHVWDDRRAANAVETAGKDVNLKMKFTAIEAAIAQYLSERSGRSSENKEVTEPTSAARPSGAVSPDNRESVRAADASFTGGIEPPASGVPSVKAAGQTAGSGEVHASASATSTLPGSGDPAVDTHTTQLLSHGSSDSGSNLGYHSQGAVIALFFWVSVLFGGCAHVSTVGLDNTPALMERPDFSAAAQAAPEWVREALRTIAQLEYEVEAAAPFGVKEAGVPEAGVPEAGVPDAGVPDAGVGLSHTGGTPQRGMGVPPMRPTDKIVCATITGETPVPRWPDSGLGTQAGLEDSER